MHFKKFAWGYCVRVAVENRTHFKGRDLLKNFSLKYIWVNERNKQGMVMLQRPVSPGEPYCP